MKPENPARSIALMALGIVALGGGLVYWQFSVHGDAEARLGKLKADTPDETKLQKQLTDAQAALYKSSTDLQHLEGGVPTLAYVPTLLKELEEVGRTNNLQVTVFKQANTPGTPVPAKADAKKIADKPYDEIEFDVSGRGSYQAVGQMLDQLQKFPKIVSVESVGVTPKRDAQGNNGSMVEATMHLKAFIFKQTEDNGNLQANNTKDGAQ